jgi:hypothetical protein
MQNDDWLTQPLEERFNRMLTVERLSSWLSQAFAGAALLLVRWDFMD